MEQRKTFVAPTVYGKDFRVRIHRHISLFGVEGFALHRAIRLKDARLCSDSLWCVSHVASGRSVARQSNQPTQRQAIMAAEDRIREEAAKKKLPSEVFLRATLAGLEKKTNKPNES